MPNFNKPRPSGIPLLPQAHTQGEKINFLRKISGGKETRPVPQPPQPAPRSHHNVLSLISPTEAAPMILEAACPPPTLSAKVLHSRHEKNMSFAEKISRWFDVIPYRVMADQEILPDCYPAVTSYSSNDSDPGSIQDFRDEDMEAELQSRKVTRYTTRLYLNESEPITNPAIVRQRLAHSQYSKSLLAKTQCAASKM